jgi:16S rRNA (adenine1518-N6/adenine1519-N6)-dimethyltransferase
MPIQRRPKLGQHFLSSERFRRRIADALDFRAGDLVIEIGPGRGAMTGLLAKRARQIIAIELDGALAQGLQEQFRENTGVEILHADFLSTDLAALCQGAGRDECFVFGNLPYYITSPILHHLFKSQARIRGMGLLMQREVADRVTAAPGSRDYGYLSVLAQFYSHPELQFHVPPGAFSPPPKVQSALVKFQMARRFPAWSGDDDKEFLEFVMRCFAQKRKSLLNNLKAIEPGGRAQQAIAGLSLAENVRAEQVPLETLAELYTRLQ